MKALSRFAPAATRFVRENSAVLFCIAGFIALAAPFLWNIHLYASWGDGHIAESSIYSIDKARFFSDFRHNLSVFNAGQYSVFVLNYSVLYALWDILGAFFSDITAYLTLAIGFYLLAYVFIVRLFMYLIERKDGSYGSRDLVTATFVALLFLSSLSMFDYIKSNILFALPYLVLPPLLYYAARYLDGHSPRNLGAYVAISFVLTDLNLAHALIIVGFVNVFSALLAWDGRYGARQSVRRILVLNVCALPALCVLFGIVLANALYTSGLGSFAAMVAENMYSDNARFLNIFAQLTDWGIFGSWNGELYYGYSPFYLNPTMWLFGAVPYVWLGYGALIANPRSIFRRLALALLVVAVMVFAVMLGNNNPAYRFLYTHVVAFQIFRNITKLAPLLLLSVLLAGFLLVRDRLRERPVYVVTLILLAAALIYNIPFWSYSSYFFRDRAMRDIPEYWTETAKFMNQEASPQSKILALPAIYINDIYNWDGKPAWVQGSLMDVLFRVPSYRLSECCIGAPQFQADAKSLFVPSRSSIRKLDIDYHGLSKFVRKYHFDYVIVTDDLRSEYQRSADISRWFPTAGYTRVAVFGPLQIYENPELAEAAFQGPVHEVRQENNLDYEVVLRGLKGKKAFTFARPFSPGWRLYWSHNGAGGGVWSEFADVLQKRQIPALHIPARDGSNTWTVDVEQIIRHAPTDAYQNNADGSIDLRVKLLFAPQAYVYIIIFVGLAGFLGLIICIALAVRKLGVPVNRTALAGIVAGLVIISAAAAYRHKQGDPSWFTAAQADHALTNIVASAAEADTIYEPSTCMDGATSCVRFYAHDGSGGQHYWGWDYDAHRQLLRPCGKYSDLSGPCVQWASGEVHNIANFDITSLQDGEPGKSAVLLRATAGNSKFQKPIHAGRQQFTSPIPDATLPPFAKDAEVADPEVIFENPGAARHVTTVSLRNFGPFSRYISQPWGISGCSSVAAVAILPSKTKTDFTGIAVRPTSPGRCTFQVTAAPGYNIASPATVSVIVMGPLSWLQGDGESNKLVFASAMSPAQTLAVHKAFSSGSIDLQFGQSCSAIASFHAGDTTIDENHNGASRAIAVKPIQPGRCVTSIRDQYNADAPVRVEVVVMGPLSFSPKKSLKTATLRFSGTNDALKTLNLYKQYDSALIKPVLGVNGCSAVAGFEFDHGFAPPEPAAKPATTQVLVRPASIGRCTVTFTDQYGNDEQGITARISVSPEIVFASALAPAKSLQVFNQQQIVRASLRDHGCSRLLQSKVVADGTPELRPIHAGVCKSQLSIHGSNELFLKARVMGGFTVAHASRGNALRLRFSGLNSRPQTVEFMKTWDNEALVPTLIRNGCVAMAGLYLQPAHVPVAASTSPALTKVVVRPIKRGSCAAVFGDQYGNQDRTVTISIQIGTH